VERNVMGLKQMNVKYQIVPVAALVQETVHVPLIHSKYCHAACSNMKMYMGPDEIWRQLL
jgi:hypothetical protein